MERELAGRFSVSLMTRVVVAVGWLWRPKGKKGRTSRIYWPSQPKESFSCQHAHWEGHCNHSSFIL